MRRHQPSQRGYSLAELLTVVGIMGAVAIVSLPAFLQLMPQYRIRNGASEIGATLRMLRQKAVSTRTSWKMTVDPVNERYALSELSNGSWIQIGSNGRPLPASTQWWMKLSNVDITGASQFDVTMESDGTAAAAGTIVLASSSQRVKFNRYTINIAASGTVTITPSKV